MAGEDPGYTGWIRKQPCCAPGCQVEREAVTAHHHTRGSKERRGKGQRAHDHDSMPLHFSCHMRFHAASGPFKHWERAQRIEWQDAQVTLHREQFFGPQIDRQDGVW